MATVITDKLDYQPGATANITAEGFLEGSTITFQVLHASDPGADGLWGTEDDLLGDEYNATGSGHESWTVTDGGAGDLDGLANGIIKTTWYVNPDDSFLEKFRLTAVGDYLTPSDTTDDQKAVTTFTDGQLALWAWRNQPGPTLNSWDSGTTIQKSNSIYAENEVIPFRWTDLAGKGGGQDLIENQTYTIQLDYAYAGGTTYPGKLFFDYLTSYNATESAAAPFGPGSDLSGFQTGFVSTVAIPNDGGDTGGTPANPATVPHSAGNFALFNIIPGSVVFGAYTAQPENSTQEDRLLNITFTVADDGDANLNEALNVGIAWGGHLAAESVYGIGNGAANFPGASPQMVVDLNPTVSGDVVNININPNAIVPQGQITVIKDAVPFVGGAYSAQDFIYTITGPNGFNQIFTLDDDGGADATFSNQQVFFGLVEGVYTVTESPVSNWVVSNISASENGAEDSTSADVFTADVATRSVSITVANGEVWATTFTNTEGEPPNAILQIDKTFLNVTGGNGNSIADWVGDVLNYTVAITNGGNVPLTGVTVTDPLTGQNISGVTLSVGETKIYNTSYTLTQADLDTKGGGDEDVDNTAIADSNETASVSDSAVVPLVYNPDLAIDKVVVSVEDLNGNGLIDAGDKINYNIKVSNEGNVTLTGVSVVDPLTGQNISAETIAVGGYKEFASSYVISQADVDGNGGGDGDIDNTATADSDQTGPEDDSEQVPLDLAPALAIDKVVVSVEDLNGNGLTDAGDKINYNIKVSNEGNVTLTGVSVVDPLTGQNISAETIAVGGYKEFASSYVISQADVDGNGGGDGDIDNTATADSDQTGPEDDSEQVPLDLAPALAIDKVVVSVEDLNGNGLTDAGDKINYNIKVSNEGNVTLTGVSVVDPLTGQNISAETIAVGGYKEFASSYVISQADVDGNGGGDGDIDNTATADSDQTGPEDDSEQVPLDLAPALAIDKVVVSVEDLNGNGLTDAGDKINYNIKVSNEGNVTLTGVSVVDPLTGQNISAETIAVGGYKEFASSYVISQADVDGNGGGDGDIDNTATADSDQTGPEDDSEQVPLDLAPALAIDKVVVSVEDLNGNGLTDAGDKINYNIKVSNEGNVTLTGVSVVDPLTGQNISAETIAVGGYKEFASSYVISQADVDGNGGGDGDIDNTATADSDQTGPEDDSEQVPLDLAPALAIDKVVVSVEDLNGNGLTDAGDKINYNIKVSNEGNVTLTGVSVVDPLTGQNISAETIAVGGYKEFASSYVISQADVDGNGGGDGDIDNTATADSDQTGPEDDSEQVPLDLAPALAIDKVVVSVEDLNGNGLTDAGDKINYNIKVSNEGNVTLTGVSVVDPLTGQNISAETIAVGGYKEFASSYVISQADVDGNGGGDGDIDNTATADSDQTGPEDDSEQVPLDLAPALAIDKVVVSVEDLNGNGLTDAGDKINYNIKVSNEGNVTLTGVSVVDPLTGQNISAETIAVGGYKEFASSYVISQADVDGNGGGDGDIDNTATADSDQTGPEDDSEQVPLDLAPALAIDKVVVSVEDLNGNGLTDAGDKINYNIKVSNEGNVTLTGVSVVDPLTGQNISAETIAVGGYKEFASSYVISQADVDGNGGGDGDIDNTATADSDQTGPEDDSEQVPLDLAPALAIDKVVVSVEDLNGNGLTDAGDKINYNIKVSNEGNVTLTGVSVVDPLTGQNISAETIAVGGYKEFASSYVISQADVDGNGGGDGDIDNTATADSDQTGPEDDSEQVPLDYAPGLAINKTVVGVFNADDTPDSDGKADSDGDYIKYNIEVRNTGNVTLTNVEVKDPLLGGVLASGVVLAVGAIDNYAGQYTVTQADLDGKGGGDGDIDNTATADSAETDPVSDSETVPLLYNPVLDIEKYVSVDGKAIDDPTKQWEDADSPTGPTLTSTAGINPVFKFVVVNTGNVTLTNITLTDDVFNIDTTNGDKTIDIASLAVGDGLAGGSDTYEYIYTGASWKAGQHVNTATADSTESAPDADKAYYYGTMPAMVTNSSLCDFGEKFNLIFTPDFRNGSGNYKLSDSNPGQYYYNMFDVDGTAGETKTYSFEIPKEFVAQGAVPIHIYDQWDIVEHDGQMCIEPIREVANHKLGLGGGVTITDLDNDGNKEYTFDATFSDTGMLYLNMHLDFSAEKQTGWIKGEGGNINDGEDALDNPNYDNPNFPGSAIGDNPNILEGTKYNFSALIDGAQVPGSADSIFNDNIFKNVKGLGGMFQADDSSTIGLLDEIPVAGQHLIIRDSKGALMGDAITDADGWYFSPFLATGKATEYRVYWDKGNDNSTSGDVYKTVMMGGSAGKWADVDWTVVDIVGYNPPADLIIDSYSSIL